jgi:hypothetical protein
MVFLLHHRQCMKRADAVGHLAGALATGPNGTMSFSRKKAMVRIKISGRERPLEFHGRDNVVFRVDNEALIVENVKRQRCHRRIPWRDIEYLSAGDPETDNDSLFQG